MESETIRKDMTAEVDSISRDETTLKESIYPYAEMVLQELKDEYAVERAREDKLESKALTFLGCITAMLGLYIPAIPFEALRDFYDYSYGYEKSIVSVFLGCFTIGIVLMIISFCHLQKVYGIKGHPRVRIQDLRSIALIPGDSTDSLKDRFRLEMIDHYYGILCGWNDDKSVYASSKKIINTGENTNVSVEQNITESSKKETDSNRSYVNNHSKGDREINNESAKLVKEGMLLMIISFVLITISTIGLRIFVVMD